MFHAGFEHLHDQCKLGNQNYLHVSQISCSSGKEAFSSCSVHNLEPLPCTDHALPLADASWKFDVETEQATYDNVLDEILEVLQVFSKRINNRFHG